MFGKENNTQKNNHEYADSEFILLDDLVYAPLYALANSSHKLRTHIIETVKELGITKQQGQEEILRLKNMNIAYDKMRQESGEGCSIDNLQLQIPLLSIVPLSALNIEQAEIDFSTEVCAVKEQNGKFSMNARVCSPGQRDSDYLPRVSYKMKVSSIPVTEGIMRLTDMLSSNQVVKQTDTIPAGIQGSSDFQEQKNIWHRVEHLKSKIVRLKQLYKKVQEIMDEQERLRQISSDNFADNVYDFDSEKYDMVKSNIVNRIMEYQTEIMDLEIINGLDKDYETEKDNE